MATNKFRTQYNRVRNYSHAGNRFEPTLKLKFDEDGKSDLHQVGKVDCYAQIQSHADTVDLNLILERYTKGDVAVLNQVTGVYGDFTSVPKTLPELQQRVVDATELFNALPLEVRREFNHNPAEFYNSIGSERYEKALTSVVKPEIKEDVNIGIVEQPVIDKTPIKEVSVNE